MNPFDAGILLAIVTGVGGLVVHHQLWQARQARIRAEADAFGGRLDNTE